MFNLYTRLRINGSASFSIYPETNRDKPTNLNKKNFPLWRNCLLVNVNTDKNNLYFWYILELSHHKKWLCLQQQLCPFSFSPACVSCMVYKPCGCTFSCKHMDNRNVVMWDCTKQKVTKLCYRSTSPNFHDKLQTYVVYVLSRTRDLFSLVLAVNC